MIKSSIFRYFKRLQRWLNWSDFKRKYISEQRRHYRETPEDFEDLLERAEKETLVLLCYEKYEGVRTKCHRIVLYNILKKLLIQRSVILIFLMRLIIRENSFSKL